MNNSQSSMISIIAVTVIVFSAVSACDDAVFVSKLPISLDGKALGGTFGLVEISNGGRWRAYTVQTKEGQSAGSVLSDYAFRIWKEDPFHMFQWIDNRNPENNPFLNETSPRFLDTAYSWARVGTDTGLNLPSPPRFFSVDYDTENHSIRARWKSENAEKRFSNISIDYESSFAVYIRGKEGESVFPAEWLSETPAILVLSSWENTTPTFPVGLIVGENFQESSLDFPICGDVFPNWESWCYSGKATSSLTMESPNCKTKGLLTQNPNANHAGSYQKICFDRRRFGIRTVA